MFSYQSYKRAEKARKSGRLYKQYNAEKILFVFKENQLLNCWRFEKYYERIDGVAIYQEWARGEGPVVRHLCSDGRCINPIHLLRGTDYENAKDEIEVRDFEIKKMEEILNDYSMRDEEKDITHLTLLPKVSIKLVEERGYNSLADTNRYLREFYRKSFVKGLILRIAAIPNYDMQPVADRFISINSRKDVSMIIVPGE